MGDSTLPKSLPPSSSPAGTARVLRLSTAGTTARVVGMVAALALLAYGQAADTNDLFPFGTLSQFATARDMNGTVRSTYMLADTETETGRRIPMSMHVIGVGRAEIENQLGRILQSPELLQAVVDSYAALNPDEPPLTTVYLMRSAQQLRDGYPDGDPVHTELARWSATEGAG